MSTSTIRFMHCDFPGCTAQTPHPSSAPYVPVRSDGWTNAIHTHGCPDHGEVVATHTAKVTSQTRGRGRSEKTTWYLTCLCGWRPSPNWQTYNYDWLTRAHIKHLAAMCTEERPS